MDPLRQYGPPLPNFPFKHRLYQLAVVVHVYQNTQSLFFSRCCFAKEAKKFTKIYDARVQPLFCLLNLLSTAVPVGLAIVVFFNTPLTLIRHYYHVVELNPWGFCGSLVRHMHLHKLLSSSNRLPRSMRICHYPQTVISDFDRWFARDILWNGVI